MQAIIQVTTGQEEEVLKMGECFLMLLTDKPLLQNGGEKFRQEVNVNWSMSKEKWTGQRKVGFQQRPLVAVLLDIQAWTPLLRQKKCVYAGYFKTWMSLNIGDGQSSKLRMHLLRLLLWIVSLGPWCMNSSLAF